MRRSQIDWTKKSLESGHCYTRQLYPWTAAHRDLLDGQSESGHSLYGEQATEISNDGDPRNILRFRGSGNTD